MLLKLPGDYLSVQTDWCSILVKEIITRWKRTPWVPLGMWVPVSVILVLRPKEQIKTLAKEMLLFARGGMIYIRFNALSTAFLRFNSRFASAPLAFVLLVTESDVLMFRFWLEQEVIKVIMLKRNITFKIFMAHTSVFGLANITISFFKYYAKIFKKRWP